jgi:hypothetical protein
MEATVDPLPGGPDWMPITPKRGSLFHAETQPVDNFESTDSAESRRGRLGAIAGWNHRPSTALSTPERSNVAESSTSDRMPRYLDLAEEARARTVMLQDPRTRATMLRVTECYESLARQLASWESGPCLDPVISPPTKP